MFNRQAGGKMAAYGLSSAHAGNQFILSALPVVGAQIHEEPRAFPAQEDPHCLQLQHGLL